VPLLKRKQRNKEIGALGERAATDFLRNEGYRVLQCNYLCKAGEIDIIAEENGVITFVEVKTRSPRAYLPPAEAVDDDKQNRIRKAAKFYLAAFRDIEAVRYDIVSVWLDDHDKVKNLELIRNAFV
jgi:putative endonuclease